MQYDFANAMCVFEVTCDCFCSFCSVSKGEAIGKPGSRVPYLRGRFTVEGLPPGVGFKKPFCYGARQCKAIMEAADSISFVIRNETAGEENHDNPLESSSSSLIGVTPMTEDTLVQSTLKRVESDADLDDIIPGRKPLTEEDINVEDCSLNQDERLTLYAKCRDFFDDDAWTAVGHNARDVSNTPKDLVFPVYTEAEDEDFWLFYCPGQTLSTIHNASGSTKLKGYRLDYTKTGNTYSVLEHVDEIKVVCIIKTEHGPLYYEQSLNGDANGESFELPAIFKICIRATLQKYGFLGLVLGV